MFANECKPIYVQWPRVRLNFPPATEGALSLNNCRSACTRDESLSDNSEQQVSFFYLFFT